MKELKRLEDEQFVLTEDMAYAYNDLVEAVLE